MKTLEEDHFIQYEMHFFVFFSLVVHCLIVNDYSFFWIHVHYNDVNMLYSVPTDFIIPLLLLMSISKSDSLQTNKTIFLCYCCCCCCIYILSVDIQLYGINNRNLIFDYFVCCQRSKYKLKND